MTKERRIAIEMWEQVVVALEDIKDARPITLMLKADDAKIFVDMLSYYILGERK